MSGFADKQSPLFVPVLAGLDVESQSHSQGAVPLPYAAGEFIAAGRIIGTLYNGFATPAPQERPSKK